MARSKSVRAKEGKSKERGKKFVEGNATSQGRFIFPFQTLSNFATEHRGWFVLFFVLPFSLMFDIFYSIRAFLVVRFYQAPHLHEKKVKLIQKQVQNWHQKKKQDKIMHR